MNRRIASSLTAAAVLLLCVGGAYELGHRTAPSAHVGPEHSVAAMHPAAVPDPEKTELQRELVAAQASLREVTETSERTEKQLAELSDTKATLLARIDDLARKQDTDTAALASVSQQRDGLQQQLNDTAAALTRVRDDLSRAQQDRQGALLHVASLEGEVNRLNATVAVTDKSASDSDKFLAQDRDIRELMGARQLYIADVFDVQNNGQRSQPFGRVFYTRGKSLIFYAFDLEKQPGYREARAFQAWGRPDDSSGKPVSLGIFYMDSEQSRRWVLKSDNPDVLAQINAVFVTVEPHGGSVKPTGKPFLEAYLHSLPPNHP